MTNTTTAGVGVLNDETKKLLSFLHRGGRYGNWFELPSQRVTWFEVNNPLPLPTNGSEPQNLYFSPNPVAELPADSSKRTKNTTVSAVNCLFGDFDAKHFGGNKEAVLAHIRGLTPQPSVIIDSGGGFHSYWLLRNTFKVETPQQRGRIASTLKRWVDFVEGDEGSQDLCRVLRVPGSFNYKPDYAPNYPLVQFVELDYSRLYELEQLEAKLPPPKVREFIAPTAPETERPGDVFNAVGDIAPLLCAHGWRIYRTRGEVTEWTRPGKTGGVSATWNHIPRRFHVFSSNAATFEAGIAYSPFAVYALLEHGGDFSAAASTLATTTPHDNYTSRISPLSSGLASERYKSVTESVTDSPENVSSVTSHDVLAWVKDSTGWFSYEELDRELGVRTPTEKQNRRVIMKRLKDDGVIEPHPRDNKLFRYKNVAVRLIDFKSAGRRKPLAVHYPFGIERFFSSYPGNIIAVAGAADAGKTAFLLNFVRMNMYDFPIFYQSSEMGREELASRLENFDDVGLDDWNFTAEERSRDFADVIRPDCINIIDYLELAGDFYAVADHMRQIHDRLAGGIAIVALQKKRGAELGRGGDFGLEKPRLYLSMDRGKLSIQKCKNWVNHENNPNGLKIEFKIAAGCKFTVTQDWHKDPA